MANHRRSDGLYARLGLALFAVLIWTAASALPAHALDFQQEADNAARAGFVELGKLSTLHDFLNKVGSAKFRNLKVTNVKALTNALTGEVTFFGEKSHILIYSGGGAQSTFVAIEPEIKLQFSDLFGDKAKLFDSLPSEREMIALAVADVELDASDLPPDVRKIIALFFPNKDFTLKVDQGINILSLTDLDKSKGMRKVLAFLGGKGSKVAVRVSVEGNVLDSLLAGEKPVPDLKLSALLPPFQPHIGNKIKFPAALQFKMEGSVAADRGSSDLGLVTTFKFNHAKNEPPVEMELAAKVSQEEGKPPKVKFVAGLPDGKPLKHAFGVKWLTLSDYQMSFTLKGPKLIIGLTGATSFGEKAIKLGGSMLVTAETEGMPVPRTLHFSVSDGPDRVGELSLLDIVKAFEYMSRESGRTVRFDEKNIPNLAIAGTGVGKGPSISLNLKGADNAGFNITGRLLVLGKDVADVKKAYLDTDDGFILNARMDGLPKLGPFQFPNTAINVAFYASKDDRTFMEPRIILKTTGARLFGAKSSLQFVIRPSEFAFLTNQDFGSLFRFRFGAYT